MYNPKELKGTIKEISTELNLAQKNLDIIVGSLEKVQELNEGLLNIEKPTGVDLALVFLENHDVPEVNELSSNNLVINTLAPILESITDKGNVTKTFTEQLVVSEGFKENVVVFTPILSSFAENEKVLKYIIDYKQDLSNADLIKDFAINTSESLEQAVPIFLSLAKSMVVYSKTPVLKNILTDIKVVDEDKTKQLIKDTVQTVKDSTTSIKTTVHDQTPLFMEKAKGLFESSKAKSDTKRTSLKKAIKEVLDRNKKPVDTNVDNPFFKEINELMATNNDSISKHKKQSEILAEQVQETLNEQYDELASKSNIYDTVKISQDDLTDMLFNDMQRHFKAEIEADDLLEAVKDTEKAKAKAKAKETAKETETERDSRLAKIELTSKYKTDINLNTQRNTMLITIKSIVDNLPQANIEKVTLSNGRTMKISEPVYLELKDTFGQIFTINLVNKTTKSVISSYDIDLSNHTNNTLIALAIAYEKAIGKLHTGLDISSIPNPVSLGDGMIVLVKRNENSSDTCIDVYTDSWDSDISGVVVDIISDSAHFNSIFMT